MLNDLTVLEKDTRTRAFVLPKKVLYQQGHVENAEALLQGKSLQMGLAETVGTTLNHRDSDVHPAILLDFGTEFHGGVRLLTTAQDGRATANVRLCFGESASEAMHAVGTGGATNDHSTRDMLVQIPNLSDLEFGQTGYRFLYIELLDTDVALWIKSVVGVAIYRDLPYRGQFSSSDERLNRIFDTAAYTCHLCLQNRMWDGIKRDRLVWIGDMYPESLTTLGVFGEPSLVQDSLDFVREQTPLPRWMNGLPSYSLWWLLILWEQYRYTGDRDYLDRQKDCLLTLLRQLVACVRPDGTLDLPTFFFDWPTNETPSAVQGNRALMMWALEVGAHMADLYAAPEAAACRQVRTRLVNLPTDDVTYKQTAALLLLQGVPDPSGRLQDVLLRDEAHGWSTFMSYFILKAVAQFGGMPLALQTLKTYYGGMLDVGATTFWEDFDIDWLQNAAPLDAWPIENQSDIHADNGRFCYVGLRHSLCHGWSSGPVAFFQQYVLGIRIREPGCRVLDLCPDLGDLPWAKGCFPTPFGDVTVSYEKQADGMIHAVAEAPAAVDLIPADNVQLQRK